MFIDSLLYNIGNMDNNLQEILYSANDRSGSIKWAASESFDELSGKKFYLGKMEATEIYKRDDLTDVAKLLLSAVAGAVIQHLIDDGISPSDVFANGVMEVK